MQAPRERVVKLLLILDLGIKMGVNGQRHALAALYSQGKDPWYPLDRRQAPATVGDRTPVIQSVVRHWQSYPSFHKLITA
jgi:hypothetical protein